MGIFGLMFLPLKMAPFKYKKIFDVVLLILALLYLIWFIAGCVWYMSNTNRSLPI
jgi:hypothetical protein